jgi:hypothetical protein
VLVLLLLVLRHQFLALDFYRLDIYGILQISQCQDTEVQGQVCCYALHFQREALR